MKFLNYLTPSRRRALMDLAQRGPLSVYDFPTHGHILSTLIEFGWARRRDDKLYEITDAGREVIGYSTSTPKDKP